MQNFSQSRGALVKRLTTVCISLFALALTSQAQSTDIEYPTPVVANEIRGVITARDIGDPRLTRHFYLLTGTPGDLVLSVESTNLNGDVDLFTAGSLRPLTKLSIYSGLSTTSTTNSVYLRRRESLILRIEARSANDEPGTYRVRFSGGFEPMEEATTVENPDSTVASTRSDSKKVRRVNSAGARINEPLPEIANTTEPEETMAPGTVEAEKIETEKPPPAEESAPAKPKPSKPVHVAKNKPSPRTTRRRTTATAKKKVEPAPATGTATETATAPPVTPAPAPAEPVLNPRLIIETRDGVRIERYMSEVRRVTVERGQLIVVTIDGRIERRPMTTVLRVAIEP